MKIKNLTIIGTLLVAFLALTSEQSQAGILFHFTESGGNVLMTTSGTLETANLVSELYAGWGGVGIQTFTSPESNIMGDTTTGSGDVAFGFNSGTDLSPWIGPMFTISNTGWATAGTTQFVTYISYPIRPGIGISTADMVGSQWTPDISYSKAGTFSSPGPTEGTYAITDAVTSESITIQIAGQVPEPSYFPIHVLFGMIGLIAWARRHLKS